MTPKDVLWLHSWLKLLGQTKLDNPDPDAPLNEKDLYEITKAIFG